MGDLRKLINAIEARGGHERPHETAMIRKYDRWIAERQSVESPLWQICDALCKWREEQA
jgi:hypothetical protein